MKAQIPADPIEPLKEELRALVKDAFDRGARAALMNEVQYLREQADLMDAGYADVLSGPTALRWYANRLESRKCAVAS